MEKCHCGRDVYYYKELDNFTRNMCEECSTVRCDIEFPCPVASVAIPTPKELPYEETLDADERSGY